MCQRRWVVIGGLSELHLVGIVGGPYRELLVLDMLVATSSDAEDTHGRLL